jgi:hypothetical protein
MGINKYGLHTILYNFERAEYTNINWMILVCSQTMTSVISVEVLSSKRELVFKNFGDRSSEI